MPMPPRYLAEMFCDRLAAGRVYNGDHYDRSQPYKFFLRGKDKQMLLHPKTTAALEAMLLKLRDEGEDAAFEYVRREILGKR